MQLIRTVLRSIDDDEAEADAPRRGAQVWATISCTLQRYVALQLRGAAGL